MGFFFFNEKRKNLGVQGKKYLQRVEHLLIKQLVDSHIKSEIFYIGLFQWSSDFFTYHGTHLISGHVIKGLENHEHYTKTDIFSFLLFFSCHSKYITYISYLLKALEVKKLPSVFHSGNELHNRDKNRYRDILPCKLTMVLIIFLFTLDKR